MRRAICAFVLFAMVAPIAVAQDFDRARLRQVIEMPALAASYGVHYKSSERDSKGSKYDLTQKIANMQKKLTGGPGDVELLLDIRAAYLELAKTRRLLPGIELVSDRSKQQEMFEKAERDRLQDEKSAKDAVDRADAMVRPFLNTTDPKQAYLLPLFATILEIREERPWKDCEAWGRRAVSIGPEDWRNWAYLAHARLQQIPTILCGGHDEHLSKDRRTKEVISSLHMRRFKAEHVDEAEKALNEALAFHDKAKQLAPNDAKRQEQRYAFRLGEILIRNGICVYRGQKPAYPLLQLQREMLDELHAAARLYPDHLLWQSQLVHQLVLAGWQQNAEKNTGKNPEALKTFTPARPEDLTTIREAFANIEKLTVGADPDTAIYCYSMLAALSASMSDHAATERWARKILQFDPKHQVAAEQLQSSLTLQKRNAEALQAAQILSDTTPSPRNCYLLAKALVLNERYDLALNACSAGLKMDPRDVYCLLGSAALLMRRDDNAQGLKTAADLLALARRECRPTGSVDLFAEHDYLASIHHALNGEPAFARIKLQRLQNENPENVRYEKALAVVGR